jgi:hypothetical protein
MGKALVMKKSASKHKPAARKRAGGATGSGKGEPMRDADEVQENNDEHIDQDFPGYPHHPSHGRTIHNGSAGAFDATEHSHDEEDEDQDSDDFAMDR